MAHTPGPWAVNDRGQVYQVNGGDIIPQIPLISPWIEDVWEGDPEALANLQLISAAPDLLEALKAAEEYMAFRVTECSEPYPLSKVRAAIAKATEPPR